MEYFTVLVCVSKDLTKYFDGADSHLLGWNLEANRGETGTYQLDSAYSLAVL